MNNNDVIQVMKKRIWFIINPISGVRRKDDIPALVRQYLNHETYEFEIQYTKHKGHAIEIAKDAVKQGIDIVCAVGGDGSVHEVGTALIGSQTSLAVIPIGSGNGLARHQCAIKVFEVTCEKCTLGWMCNFQQITYEYIDV